MRERAGGFAAPRGGHTVLPDLSVTEDKQRILDQLRVNLQNFPDDPDDSLIAHMAAQLSAILKSLHTGNCRPAELMAALSLFGPVRARTPFVPRGRTLKRKREPGLRVV